MSLSHVLIAVSLVISECSFSLAFSTLSRALSLTMAERGTYNPSLQKRDRSFSLQRDFNPFLVISRFKGLPGVLSMTPFGEGKAVISIDDQYYPSAEAVPLPPECVNQRFL